MVVFVSSFFLFFFFFSEKGYFLFFSNLLDSNINTTHYYYIDKSWSPSSYGDREKGHAPVILCFPIKYAAE